ncbi:cytochrome P450 [Tanacetum coccineum]
MPVGLPMGGRKFTRMNKFGTKLSKIDRIFVSHHYISIWPNAQLTALPRELSDHCLLILKSHSLDYGPIPFKFFNSWLLNGDFPSIVSESWSDPHNTTLHPSIFLKCRLQHLKTSIKTWRSNLGSKKETMILELKDKISFLDLKAKYEGLSTADIEHRLSLMKQLEDLDYLVRLDLLQKAKIK